MYLKQRETRSWSSRALRGRSASANRILGDAAGQDARSRAPKAGCPGTQEPLSDAGRVLERKGLSGVTAGRVRSSKAHLPARSVALQLPSAQAQLERQRLNDVHEGPG